MTFDLFMIMTLIHQCQQMLHKGKHCMLELQLYVFLLELGSLKILPDQKHVKANIFLIYVTVFIMRF